jgi:hypothetical protein
MVAVLVILALLFFIASFGAGFILDMLVFVTARLLQSTASSSSRFLIRFGWLASGLIGLVATAWLVISYHGTWDSLTVVPVFTGLAGAVVSSLVIRYLQRRGYSMFQ